MSIEYATVVKNRSGIVTSAGVLLAANPSRRTVIIQNLGTDPLFVKFGENASTSDFDFILSKGTADDDGLGGIFSEDTLSYSGVISVDGSSVRATATEL